jgi:ssDNA-binding Zn-finger/Zn-ribbon topoisomerase 1
MRHKLAIGRVLCPKCASLARQVKTKTKANTGVVFSQKNQEHEEAGTAKQGTEQSSR